MGKLLCPCGNILSNCCSPNENEGYLFTDMDYQCERLGDIENARGVWECEKCGRIAFHYPKKWDHRVKWYAPEDGIPGNLMAFEPINIED